MRINLHSHTIYSDGANTVAVMATEAKKLGHSAYVVTDHYNPRYIESKVYYLSNLNELKRQRKECKDIAKYLDFPVIQGVELNLYHEEILLFGFEVIRELMLLNEENKCLHFDEIIYFLKNNKNKCACILCHPSLNPENAVFHSKLFEILDGYERVNSGQDWFKDREIPLELQDKKAFYNSDAHIHNSLSLCHNDHIKPIRSEEELIKFIKGRRL